MGKTMRVLIGYDGSPSSIYVLEDLKRAGLPERVEALVMTASDFNPFILPSVPIADQAVLAKELEKSRKAASENARTVAKGAGDCLRTMFPRWKVRREAVDGSAIWALVNKAKRWKAHLIVVGAHGHSELGRFMGSVSQAVLMQAPCSVRVARPPLNPTIKEGLKVLVAVDGSPSSLKAFATVRERKWPAATQFHVLSILPRHLSVQMTHMIPPDVKATFSPSGLQRNAVNKMAESMAGKLRVGPISSATAYVREGDAKQAIVAEAEAWKADCLFMGARGLSPLRKFFLGSVSTAVAARAHCSVEVVR